MTTFTAGKYIPAGSGPPGRVAPAAGPLPRGERKRDTDAVATICWMASRFFWAKHPDQGPSEGILRPRRIAVPVRGGEADKEAVRAACRLARPAKAEILVMTVLEVARSLPLSASLGDELARAEEMLGEMESVAEVLDTKIQTTILQAREAGPAVVDEARRWEADLMVVGLGIKPRFGEFALGRTGSELLRHAHCRLVLIRQAMPPSGPDAGASGSPGPDLL